MKAREVKRAKLVARYAEKRAALKQIVRTGDPAEAFEAAQKLHCLLYTSPSPRDGLLSRMPSYD